MSLFFNNLLEHTFLQYALIGGLLASIACGVVGSFVVVRRSTYVTGAIAHSVLGGMGAALYLRKVYHIDWLTPLQGATFAAIIAALIIAFVTLYGEQREDTILSAIWAIGMAVGISFITATPGYSEDLMSYLFGNILMIGKFDLIHMAILDFIIVTLVLLFYDKFIIICFQPELAILRGINIKVYYTLLLLMTAISVVLLTQVVGLVMVIALLTLPAATAFQFTKRLWQSMILAIIICFFSIFSGIAVSYEPELPAGATIIELAGATYLLAIFIKWFIHKVKVKRKLK